LVARSFLRTWLFLSALLFAFSLTAPVSGSAQTGTGEAKRGVKIQPEIAEGRPIHLVYIHLVKSTGDPAKDEDLKKQVASAFAVGKGGTFRQLVAEFGLKRVRQLVSVQSAELKLYETVPSGQVVVAILVSPLEETAIVPKKPRVC